MCMNMTVLYQSEMSERYVQSFTILLSLALALTALDATLDSPFDDEFEAIAAID
jgi:hypothetical protein